MTKAQQKRARKKRAKAKYLAANPPAKTPTTPKAETFDKAYQREVDRKRATIVTVNHIKRA